MLQPSLAEPPAVAPSAATTSSKKTNPQLDALLQQGIDALSSGDAKAACDAFTSAVSSDPRNARALHGLAIAYYRLNDFQKAAVTIDKALAVPGAADHAMAFNAGLIQLQCKQPMRAAKIARDYLTAKPVPLDEPVANLLGYSLEHADAQQQKTSFFTESRAFYDRYIHKMEAANPGQMRWGAEWQPAQQVKATIAQNAQVQPQVNALTKELADLDAQLATSKKKLADQEAKLAKFQTDEWTVDSARQNVNSLEAQRTEKKTAYDDAVVQLKKPDPIPDFAGLLPMDAACPPLEKAKETVVADLTTPAEKSPTSTAVKRPRRVVAARTNPEESETPITPKDTTPNDTTPKGTQPADPTPADPPANPDPPVKKDTRVTTYAVAFPVAKDLVITALSAVDSAKDISLQTRDGNTFSGSVVRTDETTGLALVRVKDARLLFFDLGQFQAGDVTCAAIPEIDAFTPAGELLNGTAAAPGASWTIKLAKNPLQPGAPILQSGKVVGVAMATRDSKIDAVPAVPLAAVEALLGKDAPKSRPVTDPDPVTTLMQLSATRERPQE